MHRNVRPSIERQREWRQQDFRPLLLLLIALLSLLSSASVLLFLLVSSLVGVQWMAP